MFVCVSRYVHVLVTYMRTCTQIDTAKNVSVVFSLLERGLRQIFLRDRDLQKEHEDYAHAH